MPATLTAPKLSISLTATYNETTGGSQITNQWNSNNLSVVPGWSPVVGTGTGKVTDIWQDVSLATSTGGVTIDFSTGQTNAQGEAITIAAIGAFVFINLDAAITITITPGMSDPLWPSGEQITLAPGEQVVRIAPGAGWAVVASTSQKLVFTAASGTPHIQIFALTRNA